jgi:hypothetical protein
MTLCKVPFATTGNWLTSLLVTTFCDETNDVATASLLENWIDQTQRRVWFLSETSQTPMAS